MAAPMRPHKCGMPLAKMSKHPSKAGKTISLKQVFFEALEDPETGIRDSHSHTYHPEFTHLNINCFPEGVTNRDELIDWYNDQYELNRSLQGDTYKSRRRDKETGDYLKDEDGNDLYFEKKRPNRKNPVFGFCGIIKPPAEVIGELDPKDQIQYFSDAIEIVNGILREGHRKTQISSFQIHFDEGSGGRPEAHCHYQGLAINDKGDMQGKHIANPITNTQLNSTFCERMQERGWPVEITSARPTGKEYEVTEDMTPAEKSAVRKKASAAQIAERKRRGTYDAVGMDTNTYDKYMKAKREAESKAAEKVQEAEAKASKKVDAAEDTMEEGIQLQADANEKIWKAEQKEESLAQKEQNLVAKENELIHQQRQIEDAYKWMKETKELDGQSLDMSIWDYYQEHLGGGKRSSAKAEKVEKKSENAVKKPAVKVVAQQSREEKAQAEADKALLNQFRAEVKQRKLKDCYENSTSRNKKKYSKEQFEEFWAETYDFRRELDIANDAIEGSYKDAPEAEKTSALEGKVRDALKKYRTQLTKESFAFSIIECGLKLTNVDFIRECVESFNEGFAEGYNKAMAEQKPATKEETKTEPAKSVERREKVNKDLIDDKYKQEKFAQMGA